VLLESIAFVTIVTAAITSSLVERASMSDSAVLTLAAPESED
jgi:hypothetical protein